MKERPIIFSAEMVRAILEGSKTQTRRVVKPGKYSFIQRKWYGEHPGGGWWGHDGIPGQVPAEDGTGFPCPYGIPGDRLWVRETWTPELWNQEFGGTFSPAPTADRPIFHHKSEHYDDEEYWLIPHYKATDPTPDLAYDDMDSDEPHCRWHPSIHMPRWASRITLETLNVRVERLQEITEGDAEAEGIWRPLNMLHWEGGGLTENGTKPGNPKEAYRLLWDSLNAKRGYSWASNPWVWVIKFKKVEK